jgi:2,4-dienoyl-CoA reductase-like NADH-dependent reductase (Old Yellow Enzyme family)
MFTPFTLRGLTVPNRVVVSPMAMYSAVHGVVGDFHLAHFGARALGGAGLIYTEMTCPSADARITPGCAGLWNDAQREAWKRIVDFVHALGCTHGHAAGPRRSQGQHAAGLAADGRAAGARQLAVAVGVAALAYGPARRCRAK